MTYVAKVHTPGAKIPGKKPEVKTSENLTPPAKKLKPAKKPKED